MVINMGYLDENTVPAKNQLKSNDSIFYENETGNGVRILFVGNSITLHAYKAEIGWYGENYGMAASSKDKDYVHLVKKYVLENDAQASFCICQASEWEVNWKNGEEQIQEFLPAREFNADIIIMRIVENCPKQEMQIDNFAKQYKKLIDYFNPNKKAKIILTTGFWKHPADEAIIKVGKDNGYVTVYLGKLEEDSTMMALGEYEHKGVSLHPGDRGMAEIARRINAEIKKFFIV